jgi:outer membrane protein
MAHRFAVPTCVQIAVAGLWVCSAPLASQVAALHSSSGDAGEQRVPSTTEIAPDSTGPLLTLADALRLAHLNNPTMLQSLAARRAASAAVRAAYGGLLPQLNAQLIGGYQQGGPIEVSGGFLGASSDAVSSQYGLNLTYQLSASTLLSPSVSNAYLHAADADAAGSAATVQGAVAQQYVTVLEAQALAALQDTLVDDSRAQAQLAAARVVVGSATPLDGQRADVALGQQRVQALQAHNQVEIEKLRLFQQIGVAQPAGVRLEDSVAVAQPTTSLDSVLTLARRVNPQVNALRARVQAASANVSRTDGLYAPTLQLATGIGGYTYSYTNPQFLVEEAQASLTSEYGACLTQDTIRTAVSLAPLNCPPSTLTPAQISSIKAGNKQFPFNFQTIPRSVALYLSLPIFTGFSREQQVEQAQVDRADARYNERAGELALTANVTAAYYTLTTSVKTVEIQGQNAATARQALQLAEERYRAGAATFVDVADARSAYERTETDRISAVYDYHKALAALEAAVGRPIR